LSSRKAKERRKKPTGPLSAAGLVSFYEDFEARVKLTPSRVFVLTVAFVALVVGLRLLL